MDWQSTSIITKSSYSEQTVVDYRMPGAPGIWKDIYIEPWIHTSVDIPAQERSSQLSAS
jgi:hypothetical protein